MSGFSTTPLTILMAGFIFMSCDNNAPQDHAHHKQDSTTVTSGKYEMELTASPKTIEIAMPVDIAIKVKNTTSPGSAVEFDIIHQKKIHLIVVSENLGWFNHIHPEQQQDGTFKVSTSFPFGGKFLLYADYKPAGSEQLVHRSALSVQGKPAPVPSPSPKFISGTDGYTLTLVNGSDLQANTDQQLNFTVEKDGKKLTSAHLQQYLGASAHIVTISEAEKEFIHIHSGSDEAYPISGHARFTKMGIYRIWVQFQTNNIVHTADFTVKVGTGEPPKQDNPAGDDHHH